MYKNVFGFFRNWASLFNIAYESKSHSVVSDSLQPHGIQSMQFSIPEYWSGKPSYPMLERVLLNPGIEPRSPSLQADSLLAEPQGKPKNTRVSSLFLLQQIFQTQEQEQNQGLLHCRQILYQLSYQDNPIFSSNYVKVHVCSIMSDSEPLDCSPPGSSVYVTFQARILEWVAISFSRGSFQPRHLACLFASPALAGIYQ